jgi:hypothetical protein
MMLNGGKHHLGAGAGTLSMSRTPGINGFPLTP